MAYDLAAMARRARNTRRKSVTFRSIIAPAMLAGELYAQGYAPMVNLWTEALPQIIAAYEQSLALTDSTADSPERISATISRVDDEAARVILTVRLRLSQWALRFEAWHRAKWRGAVLTATGVDLGTMLGPSEVRETLAGMLERNVSLVKSVSEQARARIADAVFRGLSQRIPAREVAKDIRESVGMARRRALNVASDQLVKVNASLNSERRREAGIDTWAWASSHKVHFRPEHAARDGQRYTDADAPQDLPGMLPYCGCTERAVLSLDGEF